MKKPPKKLSTAMRIALNDLKKVQKDPLYRVRMDSWHAPFLDAYTGVKVCNVCFAGAVMAKTCALPVDQDYLGVSPLGDWENVFEALNYARKGLVSYALSQMGRGEGFDEFERTCPGGRVFTAVYSKDPVQWRKDMFKIVHMLEKMGE